MVTKDDVTTNGTDKHGGRHRKVISKNMDRLTLPREQKAVDAGKCLPAGDSLPSWSTLPLDAKFPMVPTPKGTLTLFTTKYCSPKYRRKSSSDFDLTDPNGMSMSSEYHPLHDPHLKAHFMGPCMRRHLVRNGFITESGMVICNLREFNKYRQYLRRICLMELMRERKRDSQKDLGSTMRFEDRAADDGTSNLSARFVEARRRQIEKIEKQRMKLAMMAKMKGEQMERKRQEQMERQAETLRRRQEEEDRRRDTLMRNAEETERRNLSLLRKWRRRDRQHIMRLEDMRRQRVLDLQRKNRDSWETRKRVQQERLDREAETRERLREAKERDISERDRWLMRQRDGQMAKLDHLKMSARKAHEKRDRICTARLARRIATARRREERRYRANKSPFRSEWTLQQVLRRLSFPDLPIGSSHELMQMLSDAIDEAVDRVTSQSDVDSVSENEREMRRFAADLVESVVTKVRNEIYPAYLRLLGTGREEEAEDLYDEMYDQGEFERSDTGTDDELNFSAPTSDDAAGEKGSRSVRFSFDEAIIPVSMDSLELLSVGAAGLKPVSEHMLTPVPSPLPCEGYDSEFDFSVKGPSKPTKQESGLVESLLLRLLDDLNHGRLKREDLLKLTGYCIEVIKTKETPQKKKGEQERDEACESPSGQVANELVKFTLSKILDDIKSGSVSQEDLTALTQSLVKDAKNESGIEPDIDDDDLDRLISSALSDAMQDDQDDDEQVSDWMLEDFVTRTLSQVKDDMEDNKLTEEELKEMGSAVVSAVLDEVAQDESLMAEDLMRKTLHDVLEDVEADRLVGAVMDKVVTAIVSSYHTLTRQEKSSSEVIEEFVTDVLTQVVEGVKAGEYTEHELKQIISAKRSILVEKTDSRQGMMDTTHRVQTLIDSLLTHIEEGALSEGEMLDIGHVLVDTGRKLLAARGVPSSSTEDVDPEKMTSTEIAERVVKEVIENIQGEMEDVEFEKEALKALAASFLKVRSSSLEDFSNAPTVGSSRNPSYLSTMKPPSPTESSLAADVVLAAMDRITRDLTERNIPVHMLSSIAFSISSENEETPSYFISDEGLGIVQSSSLPQRMKSTLMEITQLLRNDRICYGEAKKIFTIILQSYLCGDAGRKVSSSIDITEEDSRMIEELIGETLNNVIRNVTADISSVSVPVATGRSSMSITKLSSVVSEEDLEKLVWDTLHRIGQEASMESVISRPSAPIQFKSHASVDSQNIESLVRETLIQVAQDISEGIASDSSLVDAKREVAVALSARNLSSKVVGFVNSVLEELIVGLERGTVSKTSIAQFMGDICPDQDFKDMEVENLHRQLLRVMEDVMQKKTASVYFHAIADKFSAIKAHGDRKKVVMTPEMQMIGNIVSNVDVNVLTQFVQATLLAVLGGVQTSCILSDQIKPGSITSLLKVESSVIARKVVDDLIARIERDIIEGVVIVDETVRKDSSDLANRYVDNFMCQIQCEIDSGQLKPDDTSKMKQTVQAKKKSSTEMSAATPAHTREPSHTAVSSTAQSLSGKFSAYVLETLKAVVSDLRAHGHVSESGLLSESEAVSRRSSSLLDDFIYKQLQQTVESIQHMPTASSKDEKSSDSKKRSVASSEETPPATREASGLINDVLNEVVAEMIVENVTQAVAADIKGKVAKQEAEDSRQEDETLKTEKSKSSHEETQDAVPVTDVSSTEIAKFVLATLRHVLSNETYSYSSLIDRESSKESSGTEPDPTSVDSAPKKSKVAAPPQSDSSTPVVTEAEHDSSVGVSELVAEVINQTIMNIKEGKLSHAEMSCLAQTLSGPQKKSGMLENFILDVLEGVKGDILGGVVSTYNIENVAQQLATLSIDKKDGSVKKQPSKIKTDLESSTSVQSMVKEVLSHIVVSLSDEGSKSKDTKKDKAPETSVQTPSIPKLANTNGNTYVRSPCSGITNASPDVISDLANMSIRDSPGGLEPCRVSARNSFRSVVLPDEADRVSASKTSIGACSIAASLDSDISLDDEVIVVTKRSTAQAVASSKSVSEVKKKPSKDKQSDVSVSSVDSSAIDEFVRECLPKDVASLKSSNSDLKQKGTKKVTRTSDTVISKKSSTHTSKTRDNVKKSESERGSKTSVPAIQIDSCSSTSNTSSRTRTSSSSCATSSGNSKQDVRTKKTAKKREVKDVPDIKVTEACGDAHSTSSDVSQCSSQPDVMQVRSVCGSHTTQVRVRDSQSESSKD